MPTGSSYESKKTNFEAAMQNVQSNQRVVLAMAASEPWGICQRLADRCATLQNVRVYCANPNQDYDCYRRDDLTGRLELNVMFLTSVVRNRQGGGRVNYVPQHLSQWVNNLLAGGEVDIFWGSCTPPDERGFVSLGPGACYEPEILRKAKRVILEVNPRLPQTFGATYIPSEWVDHFVEFEHELPEVPRPAMSAVDHQIAANIAQLIPDGATLQLGIGSIPNAIGIALESKKDLGIHTEMINDTIMDLFMKGVVTGRCKTIWPGKIVGSFAYGSRKLYDFIDRNPLVDLQPSSVVNDPYRIGRNHRMFSINTAVEVDITGQVCSESVGHRELSGVGGASETHIGAQRSEGGRGIIAIPSGTKEPGGSKIVFELKPGAKVSISRNDVDTIVTEHGVAHLRGKSVSERVKAMIAIAAPQARDELMALARKASYL